MKKKIAGFAVAAATTLFLSSPVAAEKVKIGFVTTLTTGAGAIGQDMQRSANLAIEHLGGKTGPPAGFEFATLAHSVLELAVHDVEILVIGDTRVEAELFRGQMLL